MYLRTTEESIELAQEFIARHEITDEDTKQDIYLKALESNHVKKKQEATNKFTRVVVKHSMNNDDIYVTIDESTVSPFTFESVERDILHNQLEHAMDTISERERIIINLRYVYNMTCREIGNILGLSKARINIIEQNALRKLKQPSRSKLYKDFLIETETFIDARGVKQSM